MSSAISHFINVLVPISVVVPNIDPLCTYNQEMTLGEVYYIFNKEYPEYYSAGTACQWKALSPVNSKIFLSCQEILLRKSWSCNEDRLEISTAEGGLHSYCGNGTLTFVTKKNNLDIALRSTTRSLGGRFVCSIAAIEADTYYKDQNSFQNSVYRKNNPSRNSAVSNFFNILIPIPILIQNINPNCVYYQVMTLGERYYIFNKEYPGNYSSGTACQWKALSPINSKVVLACDDVHLPKSLNCFQDRLEISSSENDGHKYCGNGGFMFVTKENTLDFVLRSTTRSPGGRFLCTITSIEDKIEESQNSFQNPNEKPGCQCGWKNDKRIVGGHDTLVNEYPAMAGVVRIDIGGIFCGGTIISRNYVLTAAHCVVNQDVNNYRVLVGDHDTSIGSDTNSSAIYRARKFIVHPKYNSSNYNNDLALIQVDIMVFNDNVGPICLPFRYTANTFEEENVTVIGWGHKEFSGINSDILQEVNLDIISNQMCRTQGNFTVSSSQICTYTSNKDACQSDSGGPLIWQNFRNMTKLFLIGVISYGVGCASSSPGVHTRVTSFLNWIIEATSPDTYCIA
ncbi:venom serine protease 34-like isoform X2 [Euwallacea fornicatus]